VYCFGENYPYKPHARLMRRIYQDGAIGMVQYAECEYLHGFSPTYMAHFGETAGHWRLRISSLAYGTHSIAPVMYVTDTRPTEVSSFVIPGDDVSAARAGHGVASISIVRLDNDAYLKSLHGFLQGEQQPENSWIRIHASHGLLENLRVGDSRQVRLRKEDWSTASGETEDRVIDPALEPSDDLLACESFRHAVETGEPPYFDVYRGVAASLVSICGLRSLLNESRPVAIPDLRDETARHAYEADTWNGLE
jgi:predicted dehydrogenase